MPLTDGRVVSRTVTIPHGFAGSGDDIRALMRAKLAAAVGNYEATQLLALVEHLPVLSHPDVARLIQLMAAPGSPDSRSPAPRLRGV